MHTQVLATTSIGGYMLTFYVNFRMTLEGFDWERKSSEVWIFSKMFGLVWRERKNYDSKAIIPSLIKLK